MSGNPFRGSGGTNNGRLPLLNTGGGSSNEVKGKVVKKVQFVSPVASPEEITRHPWPNSQPDIGETPISQPPTGLNFDEASLDTRALLRGDQTGGGVVNIGEPATSVNAGADVRSGRSPINPFAKTLATMEPEQRAVAMQNAAIKASADVEQQSGGRSALDVDAFKRLLLTGNSGITTTPTQSSKADEGNSVNAPSVPRQSVYETMHEPHPESPDSSLESASSEDEDNEEKEESSTQERANLASNANVAAEEQAPSVAIPQTQLPVEAKGPQVVSFDDFDSAFDSYRAHQAPKPYTENLMRPRSSRSSSDLNKPLPAPPSAGSSGLSLSSSSSKQTTPATAEDTTKKIPPPPPPAARRQIHSKTSQKSSNTSSLAQPSAETRARSGSNLSQTSVQSGESSSSKLANRPPPPAPRQGQIVSGDSASDVSSLQLDRTESNTTSDTNNSVSGATKMRPPPPPSRLSARPNPQTRTPSSQSAASVSRRVSVHGPNPPPLPPPRRGATRSTGEDDSSVGVTRLRGGSQSSRKSSGQSIDTDRRDSVSSLQRAAAEKANEIEETIATGKVPSTDMLADLDAFQREVDALRARALSGQ